MPGEILQDDGSVAGVESSVADTVGGTSIYSAQGGTGNSLLTNTVIYVKKGAANLYGMDLVNTGGSDAWVQFFDAAAGVTLGTTIPKMSKWVPKGGSWEQTFADERKISFANGLAIAAATTSTGSTAPGTGINANLEYK